MKIHRIPLISMIQIIIMIYMF